jgi:hypothetical protein
MIQLLISIGGAVIALLLGIISYFIVKDQKRQGATNERLFTYLDRQRESTEKLNISITALNGVLLTVDEKYNGLEKRFTEHRDICRFKTA